MNANICTYPLVEHRVNTTPPSGTRTPTRMVITECFDPNCDGLPETHDTRLPCQWSWKLAHGKTYNGAPFPKRRCPGCDHFRLAGLPDLDVIGA